MEDLIGKKIESYSIVSVLGKGGMGVVYKAHDEKLDRFVAIKVLDVKVVDKSKFVERFKREARHQAQLSHPNIVTVYGFIDYKGLLGIVMEYVKGESLEKVLFRQKRLHIFDVVYIMRQVLLGIGYAHSKGFVHRDIKPSNIILNSEGTVKIMDFGISKSMLDKEFTKTGSKLGTVYYMSPEQIKGEDVDSSADIYAIGCTIYEMVAGKPPFYNESEYEVMDGHLKKEPSKLSQIIPGTPPTIEDIVAKCLNKNPQNRFAYCGEILEKLHELDEYLKNVEAKYFIRTKKDPKKTKAYSIFSFSLFIIIMSALTYFVYVQVGELLNSDQLDQFKKYSIESLFEDEQDSAFSHVRLVRHGEGISINSIKFINDGFGIAVGDSALIMITNDSGKTWQDKELKVKAHFNDVYLADDGTAFLIGDSSAFLMSDDYFTNSQQLNIANGYSLFKIKFIDRFTGFVLGSKGLILRTSDGGKNWRKLAANTEETLYDIDFLDQDKGFIVGWKGTILKTEDGGITWTSQETFTNKYLKSIDFYDEIGLAVGGGNSLYVSDDGGNSWETIQGNTMGNYQYVKYLSDEIAIAVGSRGMVNFSLDEGRTWHSIDSGIFSTFNSIEVTPSGKIFLGSNDGSIIKLF